MRKMEDDFTKKILMGLSHSPKCPSELSRIYDIPIAICYERIRFLETRGTIEQVLTLFTRKGKALRFYQLSVKSQKTILRPLT